MGTAYSLVAVAQWKYIGNRTYGRAGYEATKAAWEREGRKWDFEAMTDKTCVVTGSNSGLGYATASMLAELGANVHMVCRSKERGEKALAKMKEETGSNKIYLHLADLGEGDDIRRFADEFLKSERDVHVLVNNAGWMPQEIKRTSTGNESGMAVAVGGVHLLTSLLLPALKPGEARVINVSSGGQYLVRTDPDNLNLKDATSFDPAQAYCFAKRAQTELTGLWAKLLEQTRPKEIDMFSMHPGWAHTPGVDFAMPELVESHGNALRTQRQGADTIVYLASSPDVKGRTGLFWFDREPRSLHMKLAGTRSSADERRRLWENCCKMFDMDLEGPKDW